MTKVALEILKAIIFRLPWHVLFERFVTRGIVWGLNKLVKMKSNDLVQGTADDLIKSLEGKRLAVIDGKA